MFAQSYLDLSLSCIFDLRDLKDIDDPRHEVQEALAKRIRDVCIDVGFFYGAMQPMLLCLY